MCDPVSACEVMTETVVSLQWSPYRGHQIEGMDLKLTSIPAKCLLDPPDLSGPVVDALWTSLATPNSVFMVAFSTCHPTLPTPLPYPPPIKPTVYSYAGLYKISAYT